MEKLYIFCCIIIIIILVFIFINHNDGLYNNSKYKPQNIIKFRNNKDFNIKNNKKYFKECKVDTLNNVECLLSQYNKCPQLNGSYCQCTNNYLPKSPIGRCKCNNRGFELCPNKYKISDKCYNLKLLKNIKC
jgi:hypothetical protein